jgi:hypothetical protein
MSTKAFWRQYREPLTVRDSGEGREYGDTGLALSLLSGADQEADFRLISDVRPGMR